MLADVIKTVGPRRWKYLGLLEYLRHYPTAQLDPKGKVRKVWIFEFKIHQNPQIVPLALDQSISIQMLTESRKQSVDNSDDEIICDSDPERRDNFEQIEQVRGKLLIMEPKAFEFFIKDLLVHTGFTEVCVTRYSADGGVDVYAKTGGRMWIFGSSVVQVQAKTMVAFGGKKRGCRIARQLTTVC